MERLLIQDKTDYLPATAAAAAGCIRCCVIWSCNDEADDVRIKSSVSCRFTEAQRYPYIMRLVANSCNDHLTSAAVSSSQVRTPQRHLNAPKPLKYVRPFHHLVQLSLISNNLNTFSQIILQIIILWAFVVRCASNLCNDCLGAILRLLQYMGPTSIQNFTYGAFRWMKYEGSQWNKISRYFMSPLGDIYSFASWQNRHFGGVFRP